MIVIPAAEGRDSAIMAAGRRILIMINVPGALTSPLMNRAAVMSCTPATSRSRAERDCGETRPRMVGKVASLAPDRTQVPSMGVSPLTRSASPTRPLPQGER
jgi:hypothetical protein